MSRFLHPTRRRAHPLMFKHQDNVSSAIDGKPVFGDQIAATDSLGNSPSRCSGEGVLSLAQPMLTNNLGAFVYLGQRCVHRLVSAGGASASGWKVRIVDGR